MKDRKTGFTLIELLIVVAIIAILAAIAVPNFLEAQTRSRVSRSRNDLRTIAVGMESYFIDNNSYPSQSTSNLAYSGSKTLTTPISYLEEWPKDIFRAEAGISNAIYRFYTSNYGILDDNRPYTSWQSAWPRNGWHSWSYGPDLSTEIAGYTNLPTIIANEGLANPGVGKYGKQVDYGKGQAGQWIAGASYGGCRYDATNGTVSIGDLYYHNGASKRGAIQTNRLP
jgi:prepilin-type N-terminal cleavage/methylation domain-containing protein